MMDTQQDDVDGMTAAQRRVLHYLRAGPARPSLLVADLEIDALALSVILNDLAGLGLARKVTSHAWAITDEGRAAYRCGPREASQ